MQIQAAGAGCSNCSSGAGMERFSSRRAQQTQQNQQVSASNKESISLKLQTAEGDTVTLSAQALDALAAGRTNSGLSAGSSSQIGLQVSVEGDLSPDELKDVQQAAKALLKALNQAQHGNTRGALRSLASIAEQDNIASASFHYERQQSVSYYA